MNLKFSNFLAQKKESLDSIDSLKVNLSEFTEKNDKTTHNFNTEGIQLGDDDYYTININSFKRSFSKLQKNYILNNRKLKNADF